MSRTLVAGVDSSTQSTKVVVCDSDTGEIVRQGSAVHPGGTECDPQAWWSAWERASADVLEGVSAIAVAGQQHGMVALDESGSPVRKALLWNDVRSARAARDLVSEKGADWWARAVGSVPVASFTITKLRWMAEHEPENARRTHTVLLPHDWLTMRLTGGDPVTDRGDASGTGYFPPWEQNYRTDVIVDAFGRQLQLPRIARPAEIVGHTSSGIAVAAGTGDNMGAALGLGIDEGDVVVSIGTSGTVFLRARTPTTDATGAVAGFADASGGYLPLVCTLNAARVLDSTAALLRADHDEFDRLALAARPGADGLTLLPYLDGERTPNRPDASGVFAGLTTANATPENLARAGVEGMLCGLADGIDALRAQGMTIDRLRLIGGGAASAAVRRIAPQIFGLPVSVPAPGQYVALGAARQAAWALAATPSPPRWYVEESVSATEYEGCSAVREHYARLRDGFTAE